MEYNKIVNMVADTLIKASSAFSSGKKTVYRNAIQNEKNACARWVMEEIVKNESAAVKNSSPLCDDTGIPHIVIDIGEDYVMTGRLLEAIHHGVRSGLRKLPGRPMAVKGNDYERIEQSSGMSEDPADLECAPFLLRKSSGSKLKIHIIMLGGGPAIRGKTYRIFHKHNTEKFMEEIEKWAIEATKQLGCTPSTLAIGIGRSQYEASSLMMEALVDGDYESQTEMEKKITEAVNEANIGPLGLGGKHTVLATFMKVGPQRASGVRIVCLRPCCCFEPRIATLEL